MIKLVMALATFTTIALAEQTVKEPETPQEDKIELPEDGLQHEKGDEPRTPQERLEALKEAKVVLLGAQEQKQKEQRAEELREKRQQRRKEEAEKAAQAAQEKERIAQQQAAQAAEEEAVTQQQAAPQPQPEPESIQQPGNSNVQLLAQLVQAEANGEPYTGMVAVAEVVINRTASGEFPGSIEGVVYQPGQFSPVSNGMINNSPSDMAIQAANEALSGSNYTGGALYFYNPQTATDRWLDTLPVKTVIGNHHFK